MRLVLWPYNHEIQKSLNSLFRLPPAITQLTSMTSLGLNDISLTQMPHDIGQLRNLRSLEVRENLLRTVPPSISQLSQLRRLDLGHNELDDLVSFLVTSNPCLQLKITVKNYVWLAIQNVCLNPLFCFCMCFERYS